LINYSLDWFKGKSTGKPYMSYYFMVWFPVNFPSTNPLNYGNITRFFFHGGADNLGDRDGDLNIKLVTKKNDSFHLFMLHE